MARKSSRRKKIFVPVLVGLNKASLNPKTWAFVRGGKQVPADDFLMGSHASAAPHLAAQRAPFYLKKVTSRMQEIRARLKVAHIPVEEPMPHGFMGKDLELFERRRWLPLRLTLRAGKKEVGMKNKNAFPARNRKQVLNQVAGILARMHAIGISHNHPHGKNFVVSPRGSVKVIDLSLARIEEHAPRSPQEFLTQFGKDFLEYARLYAYVLFPGKTRDSARDYKVWKRAVKELLARHSKVMDTFQLTPEEVLEHGLYKHL
ncbi:MAG: hypothetical protein HY393_00870 [Candidatus Diapherotrites archaeon]|nr:hypothetical protein [Candidatus Diapherotrites archaeon]